MRLRYIYSACTVVETKDLTLVSDPWFTPGIYDGSWFQYPPIKDPVQAIGPADVIYISHIHPDHYDAAFLRSYLAVYPQVKLLIGETTPNYLLNKMRVDGFSPEVASTYRRGDTECFILPNHGYETDNIDTALVIRRGGQSIVNMNDNPFDGQQIEQIRALLPEGNATLALLPHAGAGPYPQTYCMHERTLLEKADKKKQQFLTLFTRYVEALRPQRIIPFAGKYWLGGPLSRLNATRGLADATEAAALFPDRAVVLADGGKAYLDLDTLQASAIREAPYEEGQIETYLNSIEFKGYDYERELQPLPRHALPLAVILPSAYRNAMAKAALPQNYWLCLKCPQLTEYFVLNISQQEGISRMKDCASLQPRCEMFVDDRYLFGLLTRLYHWNNAEIGSQFICLRVPDTYNPQVQQFLNRFQV
jgi:UDP-MurNAc hydroxylase